MSCTGKMKKDIKLFAESIRLAKKFPKKVITHAVSKEKIFLKILKEGKIKLPSENKNMRKMTPYMERILGMDDCVYLGLGFVYNSSHHNWSYAFIFDKKILLDKNVKTYSAFLISNAWLRSLRKIREEDINYLLKIRNKNKITKREIDIFIKTGRCNWFHIEKELRPLFDSYVHKKEHIDYIKDFQRRHTLKNSYAPKYMAKEYHLNPNFKKFEAVSNKSINLSNKNLIGFYISGKINGEIKRVLKESYIDKIIFDGNKIELIKDIK
jgi:hypothetical protein